MTYADPDYSDEEERLITIGPSDQGQTLIIAYTERDDRMRMIVPDVSRQNLINQHISVVTVRDDLDKLVMDADLLEELVQDPQGRGKELEIKIVARLRRHKDNPVFVALGEQLEELKKRQEQGLVASIDFLKRLLEIAKDVLAAEKTVDPVEEQDAGKAALTELFSEVRNSNTPIIAERIVNEIDEIVRIVRFPGWQQTNAGEREVKQALRRALRKYDLHQRNDLFERAYAYVAEYY